MSSFNGAEIGLAGDPRALSSAAYRAAALVLQDLDLAEHDPLPLGMTSRQIPQADVSLDIDFSPFFEFGLPCRDEWNTDFPCALDRIKETLVARSCRNIRLRAFAHLSLGLLFGFVFRETTGFCLDMEQTTRGRGATIWTTTGEASPHDLSMNEYPAKIGSQNLCVTINFVARDYASVAAYAAKSDLQYRVVLDVVPPQYPHIISGGEAITVARDLADRIKELHGRYGTTTVHLFAAIPLGLAVLIGHKLNACGTIHCYEFDNAEREYHPSCVLQDSRRRHSSS